MSLIKAIRQETAQSFSNLTVCVLVAISAIFWIVVVMSVFYALMDAGHLGLGILALLPLSDGAMRNPVEILRYCRPNGLNAAKKVPS